MSEAGEKAIQDTIARIEEIVFEETGQHVFRDGRDGSFTVNAGEIAKVLGAAQAVSLPDRETLAKVIDKAIVIDPEQKNLWRSHATSRELADAVLAALSTQPAAGEVQYARRHRVSGRVFPLSAEPERDWCGESQTNWEHVQRTVGPWVEVQPEPQPTELANLFPGTLAALDNLNIRPEVQA